jgi:hypothetical protein
MTRQVPENFDANNPWRAVGVEEKLCGLLATLSESDLDRLNKTGLCADDLRGEARADFLALIPQSVDLSQTIVQRGESSETDDDTMTLDEAARPKLKLQICRGFLVQLMHQVSATESVGSASFNSLEPPMPLGTKSVHSTALENWATEMDNPQEQEAAEKIYTFAWSDPRLTASVGLTIDETIGSVVDRIRQASHLEIYADARIAGFKLHAIGTTAKCGELLHAIVIAADGVLRPVGPAFVITDELEGKATRNARRLGLEFLARLHLEGQVSTWIEEVSARLMLEHFKVLQDDPVATRMSSKEIEAAAKSVSVSHPISDLSPGLRDLAKLALDAESSEASAGMPKDDQCTLSEEFFSRWILPDGRTAAVSILNLSIQYFASGSEQLSTELPFRWSDFAKESAVEICPGGAAAASSMIKSLKAHGIDEIWLDSTDPAVIAAAIGTGAKIDLVIRPWRQLKNEPLPEPDINVMGQTGEEVAKLPTGRIQPHGDPYPSFTNSFAPSNPDLLTHWQRLFGLIPKSGLHRIVVLEPQIGGYRPLNQFETLEGSHPTTLAGHFTFGSLLEQDPAVNDFGYVLSARLHFLREHCVDPIDLDFLVPLTAITAEVEAEANEVPEQNLVTELSLFDQTTYPTDFTAIWKKERELAAEACLAQFRDQLDKLGVEVCFPKPRNPNDSFIGRMGTEVEVLDGGKKTLVSIEPVGPLYSEDEQGNIEFSFWGFPVGAVCFDFRVPADEFDRYVNHFFKPTQIAKKKQ